MAIDTGALYYLVDPFVQWENVNGKPIVGGHVEVFEAGTDNKIITYADWDGTRHPFKIPLGSDGRAVILVDPGYRYDAYVYDSFNNLVCSRLNIIPLSDGDITIDGMGQVYHDETLSGKGTPNSPLTVISGGKVYGGIYPIDVNNELDMISADNVPLGVQAPLYFAQDDDEGLVIALSSVPVPEGTMNESAFSYQDGQITSYNGSAFSAGNSYEAGSYIDIDGNTINVTGLQPAGNYQSAGDYVSASELENLQPKGDYYSASNPSGFITGVDLTDYAKTEDLTAYQPVGDYYSASNPSGFINSDAISSMATTGFVAGVSADITAMIPDTSDMATKTWVSSQGYLTAHQSLNGLMSANLLEISDNKITGYNGTAFAGTTVSGDFELSAGSGISIVDYPLDQKTVISVTAQGGNPEVEQAVIDNSATWGSVTAKQDELTFGYKDTAISSIDNSALYDNSAHARITTLAGRISDLSSNKLDTSAFSDVSGTFLTAHQDLSDYQTTAGMTGYLTTGDSANFYTTANESGFITGVDLTPYQEKADMTAYQPAGSYLSSTDSANFYTTANESGFISEVPAGTMNESAFGYDAGNNITAYNGSAFKAGDEFPQSATDAIGYVTATSANIDSTIDNVSSNSGAWGGSALPISAGPGIKFEMINDTLVASTDETVLFTTADINKTTAFTLTEPLTSFEKVRFEITGYTNVYAENTHQTPSANNEEITICFTYYCKSSDGSPLQMMMGTYSSNDGLNYGVARSKFLYMSNNGTTWNGNTTDGPHIQKIVGINRKQ